MHRGRKLAIEHIANKKRCSLSVAAHVLNCMSIKKKKAIVEKAINLYNKKIEHKAI